MDPVIESRTLKVRGEIIFQANRYLGGFSSSQRIFPPQTIQVLLIAQFALWPPLGHGEVWQDKCAELGFGELDRDRRRCRLCCRCTHHVRTPCKEDGCTLRNHITSHTTRG